MKNNEKPVETTSKSDTYIDLGEKIPEAKSRARHKIEGDNTFEWWYFDGKFDSGDTFVGSFHDPNAVTGKPIVAFTLYDKDWKGTTHDVPIRPADMKNSFDDIDISCPVGYVKRVDDKTYLVGWNIDNIKADFKLATLAPGWVPSIDWKSKRGYLSWAVHQAKNKIEGTITEDGITREVSGIGYADHNWGNTRINKLTTQWIWGRIFAGEYTIIFADIILGDSVRHSLPLYIAKGDKLIIGTGSPVIKQWNFATHPVYNRHYPQDISIDFVHEGKEAHIRIHCTALVEDLDLLDRAPFNPVFKWFIRTFIARPCYFRMMSQYEGSIIENGKISKIKGDCLYEKASFE